MGFWIQQSSQKRAPLQSSYTEIKRLDSFRSHRTHSTSAQRSKCWNSAEPRINQETNASVNEFEQDSFEVYSEWPPSTHLLQCSCYQGLVVRVLV